MPHASHHCITSCPFSTPPPHWHGCWYCVTNRCCNTKQRLGRPGISFAYIRPLCLPARVRKPSEFHYASISSRPFDSSALLSFLSNFILLAFKSCQEEGEKNMSSTASGVHSLNIRVGTPFWHSTNGTGPDSFLLFPRRTQARARGSVFGTVTHMRE